MEKKKLYQEDGRKILSEEYGVERYDGTDWIREFRGFSSVKNAYEYIDNYAGVPCLKRVVSIVEIRTPVER